MFQFSYMSFFRPHIAKYVKSFVKELITIKIGTNFRSVVKDAESKVTLRSWSTYEYSSSNFLSFPTSKLKVLLVRFGLEKLKIMINYNIIKLKNNIPRYAIIQSHVFLAEFKNHSTRFSGVIFKTK